MNHRLHVALLHLSPILGDLDGNTRAVEAGMGVAAGAGATWIVTPELCLSGYDFTGAVGVAWITAATDDPYVGRLRRRARQLAVTLFLSHAVRDPISGLCHNAAVVLSSDESVVTAHYKRLTIPRVEDWATRGSAATPVRVDGLDVGLLVCADSWKPEVARELREKGAQVLLSPAAWPPKPHGPEGCWSRRSAETGLPLFVCNRTGREGEADFSEGESALFHHGERIASHVSPEPAVLVLAWSMPEKKLLARELRPLLG